MNLWSEFSFWWWRPSFQRFKLFFAVKILCQNSPVPFFSTFLLFIEVKMCQEKGQIAPGYLFFSPQCHFSLINRFAITLHRIAIRIKSRRGLHTQKSNVKLPFFSHNSSFFHFFAQFLHFFFFSLFLTQN